MFSMPLPVPVRCSCSPSLHMISVKVRPRVKPRSLAPWHIRPSQTLLSLTFGLTLTTSSKVGGHLFPAPPRNFCRQGEQEQEQRKGKGKENS